MKKNLTKLFISLSIVLMTTSAYAQDNWTYLGALGDPTQFAAPRQYATAFSIGSKGYLGLGFDGCCNALADFWEFDPATNSWTQKADFAGAPRWGAACFSVGGKGYVGTGRNVSATMFTDFWEYDPTSNLWTQKNDFAGGLRRGAIGLTIDGIGYMGLGWNGSYPFKDFYKYDASTDSWTAMADFAGSRRYYPAGFSIGTMGYVGTGFDSSSLGTNDFWSYDASADSWAQVANYPLAYTGSAVGFAINNKGFMGTGGNGYFPNFYEYDPLSDVWTERASYPGYPGVTYAAGFAIGTKGYIGTGWMPYAGTRSDFYEYTPLIPCSGTPLAGTAQVIGNDTICSGTQINIILLGRSYESDISYQWQASTDNSTWTDITGATLPSVTTDPLFTPTYYQCISTCSNSGLSSTSSSALVKLRSNYRPTISYTGSTTICEGSSIVLNANTNSHYLWSTGETTKSIVAPANDIWGLQYWVINPDSDNCISASNSVTITAKEAPKISVYSYSICPGDSAYLYAYSWYTYYSTYKWSTGETTQAIYAKKPGVYNVIADGCTSLNPPSITYACAAPYYLTANPVINKKQVIVNVSWPAGWCATGYDVQYHPKGSKNWSMVSISGPATSVDIPGLKSGYYECRVRSKCQNKPSVVSDYSAITSFYIPVLREGEENMSTMAADETFPELTLYPNPANEQLTLNFKMNASTVQLQVFDITGKMLITQMLTTSTGDYTNTIDISHLSPGIYLIMLITENERINSRFVKE